MLVFDYPSEDHSGGEQSESSAPSSRASSNRQTHRVSGDGRWLSINAACEILGVDKSTLRRWSDRGRVPVFRTPGGHRRYSENDLYAFLADELGPPRRISRRELDALTRDEFQRQRDREQNGSNAGPVADSGLGGELDRMIDLSVRYASGRGNADRLLDEACGLAKDYGRHAAEVKLGSSDVVESFLRFRRPMLDAMGRYLEQENLPARRCCRAIGKLNTYLDVVLTSIVEAHEANSRT